MQIRLPIALIASFFMLVGSGAAWSQAADPAVLRFMASVCLPFEVFPKASSHW